MEVLTLPTGLKMVPIETQLLMLQSDMKAGLSTSMVPLTPQAD
jgi:hypothetical protein